jgi:hypothetical protein
MYPLSMTHTEVESLSTGRKSAEAIVFPKLTLKYPGGPATMP